MILTGTLDDGVAGLAEIKRRGGVAVVQDPETALYPALPSNAIRHIQVDYITPLREIAALVSRLAVTEREAKKVDEPMQRTLVDLTCPECRGPLWKEQQGKIIEYRCRVGHAYSPVALEEEHRAAEEQALWAALVALEESVEIAETLGPELGREYAEEAEKKRAQMKLIKEMLGGSESQIE